ncbi:hypothetical protein [Paractinoplanes rishiriensis]|uniref:Uncharacterized protein n=1 Tax=Paractinoplanes rishiriensis TaxID=1050105 RepID=A0A919MMK5_9ACTN|nr:hypothetical protein [Actinoplanes rishiriensis]GIE93051.1 hypothetical protein Ari01nite_05160 [Actinoplanes rishiriensis]
MQRIGNLVGLQEVEAEQILDQRGGQRLVLLDRQRRQPVPGLRRGRGLDDVVVRGGFLEL